MNPISCRPTVLAQCLAVSFLLLAQSGVPAEGQVPGYYVGDSVRLPDSLVETYEGGRFSIELSRRAGSDLEYDLIRRAETLIPEASQIQDAVEEHLRTLDRGASWSATFAAAANAPGQRWWWHRWTHATPGIDGVWLPYAVTGSAVLYYVTRVRQFADQPNPFGRDEPHRARFKYSAQVMRSESGGYTVNLYLRCDIYCGFLCALRVTQDRRVDFDSDGNIVSVQGDGQPLTIQSQP